MEIIQLANQIGRILSACGILMLLIASIRGIRLQNLDEVEKEKVFERMTIVAIWTTLLGLVLQFISSWI